MTTAHCFKKFAKLPVNTEDTHNFIDIGDVANKEVRDDEFESS